jgi:hypothetical protein
VRYLVRTPFFWKYQPAATAADRAARLLGQSLEIPAVGEEDRPLQGGQRDRMPTLDAPLLEPLDVVSVAADGGGLGALGREISEERLINFAERTSAGLPNRQPPSLSVP